MPYKDKEKQKEYQKNYRKLRPKSATRPQDYQFWKFIETLNKEELQMLFLKRKQDCKYSKSMKELRQLHLEMKIISEVFEELIYENKEIE